MLKSIDHLIVAVSDLDLAETNYTKLFGKPLCFGQFVTFDRFLSGKPTDVLRIRKNIGSVGRPGGTPTAHAVAEIESINLPK